MGALNDANRQTPTLTPAGYHKGPAPTTRALTRRKNFERLGGVHEDAVVVRKPIAGRFDALDGTRLPENLAELGAVCRQVPDGGTALLGNFGDRREVVHRLENAGNATACRPHGRKKEVMRGSWEHTKHMQ